MAGTYHTPGVYVEEISLFPPSVAEVATAIPAFIGYTETAPEGYDPEQPKPIRITSLFEYELLFGGAKSTKFIVEVDNKVEEDGIAQDDLITIEDVNIEFYMYYNLQMYFNNGGGPCYIVSVGTYEDYEDTNIDKVASFDSGITALENEDEPTLLVVTDALTLSTGVDYTDYYEVCQKALDHCGKLKDRFVIFDVVEGNPILKIPVPTNGQQISKDAEVFRDKIVSPDLMYSAAYYPYLKTSLNYYYDEADVELVLRNPYSSSSSDDTNIDWDPNYWLNNTMFQEREALLYNRIKAELAKKRVVMPPAGAIAGIYARVDRERGVWKAPANEGVMSVTGPNIKINEEQQENLNVHSTGKSINAIRSFIGKGTLVWGARTLTGNDNEWRYVSVRRLFNMIEESVQESTEWAVFEANDAMTWLKVKTMIEAYLEGLWRRGALAGPSPEAAFFVNVGLGVTMTSQDILEGRMNVEIGIAAVRPAEFIILKFSHKMQEA